MSTVFLMGTYFSENIDDNENDNDQMRSLVSRVRWLDSGLVVVLVIIVTMLLILIYCLLLVKYEWCHVLFSNNTVSLFSFVLKAASN